MRYGTETKLSTSDVLKKAEAYFGEGGLGLQVTSRDQCCLSLEGGGGQVTVRVTAGAKTSVDVETQEWDYQVKSFIADGLR